MFNESPVELGVSGNSERILDRLRGEGDYRRRFAEAFPGERDPVTLANTVRALACFQRTLISGDSPYDRLVFGGEMDALSEAQWRGMRLFFSDRLRCSECHGGFNFSGPVRAVGAEDAEPQFHNTASGGPGLARHTGRAGDTGAFRAPTLRNIELTAPYMHDGSLPTLDRVIDHYAAGGSGDDPGKSERLAGFELTPAERADLARFLHALTDRRFVEQPAFRAVGLE
jgi:cytochrome c peroxidase